MASSRAISPGTTSSGCVLSTICAASSNVQNGPTLCRLDRTRLSVGRRTLASAAVPAGVTIADGERILDLCLGLIEHAAVQIGELYNASATWRSVALSSIAVLACPDRHRRRLSSKLTSLGGDTILDDYELTARYRLRTHQESSYQRLVESGLSPEAAAGVLTTPWLKLMSMANDVAQHAMGVGCDIPGTS